MTRRALLDALAHPPLLRASRLADSLGVRTSLREANTTRYGDLDLVESTLADLGIRYLRETMTHFTKNATQHNNQRAAFWRLHRNLGVRWCAIIGQADDSGGTVQQFADQIKTVYGGARGAVEAVENGNEWNGANGPGAPLWHQQLRTRAQQMAAIFRGDPALSALRLIGPALVGGAGTVKYADLGDISAWTDKGNYHYYPGNKQQSTPTIDVPLIYQGQRIAFPGLPVWCTETGMHQADSSAQAMTYHPEDVAATYMPRLVLEHLRAGDERVYLFELLDDRDNPAYDQIEDHFGLVRHDGTRKPAYDTLKWLLDTLADPGREARSFRPANLPVQVTNAPADLRRLLFAKSDGSHVLALWRGGSVWSQTSHAPIPVAPVTVGVQLPATYRITKTVGAGAPVGVIGSSTTVDLGGAVALVECRPA